MKQISSYTQRRKMFPMQRDERSQTAHGTTYVPGRPCDGDLVEGTGGREGDVQHRMLCLSLGLSVVKFFQLSAIEYVLCECLLHFNIKSKKIRCTALEGFRVRNPKAVSSMVNHLQIHNKKFSQFAVFRHVGWFQYRYPCETESLNIYNL